MMFDPVSVPGPYCYRCPAGRESGACALDCLSLMESALDEHACSLTAVILEPLLMGATQAV